MDQLHIAPNVRFRLIGDEAVILNQQENLVYVANELGGRILELLREEPAIEQLLQRLLEEYAIDPATLRRDVEEYLNELHGFGVLTTLPERGEVPRAGGGE